ncbi:MAG: hypothetical protein KDA86_24220 [Planctomycetaceae bacterium]|nr:hypothetical protein [Planctomycetaceae bacterium]
MTIRYKCDSCSSKLNIKDELAGTQGKCPKCKTPFVVPQPSTEDPKTEAETSPKLAAPATPAPSTSKPKQQISAKEKLTARSKSKPPADDEDFDPVAFLMEDEPGPRTRRPPPPLSDDELPMDLELELDDDEPRPKKRSRRRIDLDSDAELELGSAAASAGAMLGGGGSSANAAKDLLTRTVEESRARAGRIDDDDPKEPSVVWLLAIEFAKRGLPPLVGIVVVAWFMGSYLMNYMSGKEYPTLGRVTGVVTLNGQPLAGAQVTFQPVEIEHSINESRTIRARSSTAYTNVEGYYDIKYDEDMRGAVVGEHLIQITKQFQGKELVPVLYSGPFSQEKRTVVEGSQEFDFAITSETPPNATPAEPAQ